MIMTERRKRIMKMKDNTIKIINDYDWKKKEDYEDEG